MKDRAGGTTGSSGGRPTCVLRLRIETVVVAHRIIRSLVEHCGIRGMVNIMMGGERGSNRSVGSVHHQEGRASYAASLSEQVQCHRFVDHPVVITKLLFLGRPGAQSQRIWLYRDSGVVRNWSMQVLEEMQVCSREPVAGLEIDERATAS